MRSWFAFAPLVALPWLIACSNPGEAACERVGASCAGVGAAFLPNCREAASEAASYNPACEQAVDAYAECLETVVDRAEEAVSDAERKNGPGTFSGKASCDLTPCATQAAQVQACAEEARKTGSATGAGGAGATTSTTSTSSGAGGGATTSTSTTTGTGGAGGGA